MPNPLIVQPLDRCVGNGLALTTLVILLANRRAGEQWEIMEKEYDLCEPGSGYDINPMIASVLASQIQLKWIMALIGSAATLRCS